LAVAVALQFAFAFLVCHSRRESAFVVAFVVAVVVAVAVAG
jgi:hypothetical protein